MRNAILMASILVAVGGCSSESTSGTGSLDVFVMPEAAIIDGLTPGTDEENISDGWTVTYTRFLATVGNFRASVSISPSDAVSEPTVYLLNLQNVPASGFALAHFDEMAATRWDRVGFDMPMATGTNMCAPGIDAGDCATMKNEELSVWVTGSIARDGSPTVSFNWKIPAGAAFADCHNSDGLSGIAITSGATQQAELTIHGDHWFFTRYPTGDESMSPVSRCASWIAAADGADGTTPDQNVTNGELEAFDAVDAFSTSASAGDCRYELSSFPHPVNNAYDYVLQMARSLGHFQGEGDCETRSDLN
ncbi:MAG: hypothetical protein IPK60_12865 [Sandaracinaceae bacterium]|nr:hypothetical protein [Sandaracinaceae bacterium]